MKTYLACLLAIALCAAAIAQQPAQDDYWNVNTPLTPYRLPPPPAGYEPQRIDLNGDGQPDAIRSISTGDTPVLWLDDDGDMKNDDIEGDTDNDCLLIDRNKDGRYGSWGDLIVDWADTNGDGKADMQIVAEYPDSIPEKVWPNGHYMWVLDTDRDQVFNCIDWNTFKLRNWERIETSDFYTDYSGNTAFLKIHAYTNGIDDLRLNWENPFLFYDPDGDGLSEMAIRLVDSPQHYNGQVSGKNTQRIKLSGRIDWVSLAVDMDNDSRPGNHFDFDFTVHFRGKGFDYTDQVHKINHLKGLPETDRYFIDPRFRHLDELIYPDHHAAPDMIFTGEWNQIWFVYDEDDDCKRWERVELYEPRDPFKIGTRKEGLDHHPQSDAAGDRGEWDTDASGKGQLYIGKFDGRLHLYGAEWGCWRIDKNASAYQAYDRHWLNKTPQKFATVKYTDKDNNGFFDYIEYDLDGDTVFEEIIDLKQLGIDDRCEIIDISGFQYADYTQLKRRMADNIWANALLAEKTAQTYGLNVAWYAKLHESTSVFEKYTNGYWLQCYLFKDLQHHFLRQKNQTMLKKLNEARFSGNWQF
ncbi:MAG: hypothetical protein LBS03_05460 [Bacteroidales bacterium]|jgi:hypothetical protein|nr:hypothetical protein [Bacteroidales bacterium]